MTTLLAQVILAGGTGALDPALYVPGMVAGYGSCQQDLSREPPQPAGWSGGVAPSWCSVWLGVE